ncbi:hypothetical protein BDB01DRAFT_788373 [Pilobolus umbonatus]|nr:hypothetical protein BDB01DRAFT_788373 [Pilobolus umbonatus]
MVGIVTPKRKKHIHKLDSCAKYPLSYYYSALTYQQAPETLALSSQSTLLNGPTAPCSTSIHTIAGDLYSLDSPVHKIPVKIIEEYHSPYSIHHLQWNQKGNTIASIDEKGQLALWHIKSSLHDWSLLYKLDLKQPIVAFHWLHTDRVYTMQDNGSIRRDSIQGCRNPYGQLGFMTVSVHGEISVHYQHMGSIFSSFSTTLPRTGRREINKADAGCYGMSLAGIDDWQRISHAALSLHDGQLYLATHYASHQPRSVCVFKINVKFITHSNGAIHCQPLVQMKITKDRMGDVTHLLFRKGISPIQLVIVFGEEKESMFSSHVGIWELNQSEQILSSAFGTMTQDRSVLSFHSGMKCHYGFISAIKSDQRGQLIMGLSDGSIFVSKKEKTVMGKIDSIDNHYYPIVTAKDTTEMVADMILSPNETHLIYVYTSGKMGITRLVDEMVTNEQVKKWTLQLTLCLCNNVDYLDIISELVRMSKHNEDKIDEIIHEVMDRYEKFCNEEDMNSVELEVNKPLEEWSLSLLERGYGLLMSLYDRLPNKKIQSINLSRAAQLPLILECFMSSVSTDKEETVRLLKQDTLDTTANVVFIPDSLWSLVSLSQWTLDYLKWILREWNMLFSCKRPKYSTYNTMDQVVHAVLLLHPDSRSSLCNLLKMIYYFTRYANTSNYQLEYIPESQPLLQRYTSCLLDDEPVTIEEAIEFMAALDTVDKIKTKVQNRWSLLLSSTLDGYNMNEIQLITQQYKDKCATPAIYLNKGPLYPFDVIQKSPIPQHVLHNTCTR